MACRPASSISKTSSAIPTSSASNANGGRNYGGASRRTAFLRGGTIEWQHIGLSHSDLDFLQGRQAQRDEILNIFGIPVGLVSENATEANAKVAERQFIERTLWPKLARIAQKITQELLPFYGATWSPNTMTSARPTPKRAWKRSAPPTRC